MRRLICAVLLLLSGCVYFSKHTVEGACTDDLNSPIRNFCVAETAKIWQGERPSSSDASWLLEHSVGTVVNLEVYLDDRQAFEQASAPQRELVVEYYHVPDYEPVHLINWSLLDNHVAHFLAIVAAAPKPVYVHCLDGIDRSNVLIASYRVLVEGVNPEEAIREIERFRSPWLHVDAKYIRSLNDRRAAILEKASNWRAHLTPAAKIECAHGSCTYSTAGHLRARVLANELIKGASTRRGATATNQPPLMAPAGVIPAHVGRGATVQCGFFGIARGFGRATFTPSLRTLSSAFFAHSDTANELRVAFSVLE